MFKKIFEYAGPYKKKMDVATVVVLVSVLMGVLPFVLAYQVISPLVMDIFRFGVRLRQQPRRQLQNPQTDSV